MKNLIFKTSFLIAFSLFSLNVLAQDDTKYGANPEQCKRDLSEYNEFVKQKNYTDAISAWRRVFAECPQSSKKMYVDGVKMYSDMIVKEKNATVKKGLIDTLMLIYDIRIKYFGEEGNVLGRKGNDLYQFDKESTDKAHDMMARSIELCKEKVQPAVLQNYMNASADLYKAKKIDAGQVVQDFSVTTNALSLLLETAKDDTAKYNQYKAIEDNLGKLFIATGAGSCDVLIGHFTSKFQANPNDVDLLTNITKYLDKGGCTDSKLFFDASIKLYELSPSANAAYNIAKMAASKKEFNKASEFYLKAIELETNQQTKAQYYYELAIISSGSPSTSRSYALKAASHRSGWGDPYILIGKLYASSAASCGDDPFHQKTVFWAAVDKFNYAKSIDSKVANEANSLIASYKNHFPNREDGFAYNVTEGTTVKVECWIQETTIARF